METVGTEPLGKDVFLRLLTTQLRHQDPLQPMDGTAFVTQLAQFSQLEQTTAMNERLDALVAGNTTLNNYGVTGLIGKEVKVLGGSIRLAEGSSPELTYRLESSAKETVLQISDTAGHIVRTLRSGPQEEGLQRMSWDGLNQDGNVLTGGDYQFVVSATDEIGGPVRSDPFSNGLVTGVIYEGNVPYLFVNGEKVLASDVVAVNG